MYNEELHKLYASPDIFRAKNASGMAHMRIHTARMEQATWRDDGTKMDL
jgi:hypothetical protein